MYKLDNAKDLIMSVLKLLLVNLIMWTLDHCFPAVAILSPTWAHSAFS
jgi:hypothetical protein